MVLEGDFRRLRGSQSPDLLSYLGSHGQRGNETRKSETRVRHRRRGSGSRETTPSSPTSYSLLCHKEEEGTVVVTTLLNMPTRVGFTSTLRECKYPVRGRTFYSFFMTSTCLTET